MKYGIGTLKLTEADLKSAAEIIDSNWLSPGPKVKQFETAFSKQNGQKFGVMVNSGTDALRIGLAALKEQYGWSDGDVVFVPSVTFVATVNVVLQLNLVPKLVDVSLSDFNINPDNLRRRYYDDDSKETKGRCVIPVHLAGKPCDMDYLSSFTKSHKLRILEDSCETMGVPGIAEGDVTAFSFYVAHLLSTGVGGMAITDDADLYKLMWSYANHGRREPKQFKFDRIGYSCRPTEFEAAVGLNQLPHLNEIVHRRQWNSRYLFDRLCDFDAIQVNHFQSSACMFFPVMVSPDQNFNKFDLMEHLAKRGIESRELMPLTNQPCYKKLFKENDYPIAKEVNERGFYIGCHQDMTKTDLEEITDVFTEFLWGKGTSKPWRKNISSCSGKRGANTLRGNYTESASKPRKWGAAKRLGIV